MAVGCIVMASIFAVKYWSAEKLEWDLNNRVPTANVERSKELGIFVSDLSFQPSEFVLDGDLYAVARIWVEHRTWPDRVGLFETRQRIDASLVICVDLEARDGRFTSTPSRVGIVDAKLSKILFSGSNNVLFSEVDVPLPKVVRLFSRKSGSRVDVALFEPSRPL